MSWTPDWRLLASIERLGASPGSAATPRGPIRLTLGDALVALPGHEAGENAAALRQALTDALVATGTGYLEPGTHGEACGVTSLAVWVARVRGRSN